MFSLKIGFHGACPHIDSGSKFTTWDIHVIWNINFSQVQIRFIRSHSNGHFWNDFEKCQKIVLVYKIMWIFAIYPPKL